MTEIDDQMLMAFADGELSGEAAERVAAAVAADPALAERVARHRAQRAALAEAFAPVLDEPVPPALAAAADRRVVGLDEARARREARRPSFAARWGTVAAALLVGVVAGHLLDPSRGMIGMWRGELVARAELAAALDDQLAAHDPVRRGSPVRIGLTFRDREGAYCRTFTAARADAVSGIACRDDGRWALRMAVAGPAPPAGGGYRMAAGDAAILEAAQAMMGGEPLDAAAEKAARDRAWKR
jgi:anti-sigma factor RsiW